ncbi:hemagglutinin repeat-containing protein [Bordetella sp. 02P26C-1]|uniref:hemagglutinin repeat-containing protein n=1 Tax=Bordetella sp. 02P26C-1 TaxID=2683195 RepID=UPI0013659131|nr:hemagglutinin repeat-containing protein [Bordetella sp. 02P26C-1]
MSKLRSFVVWLILCTQVWTPVMAQTLPISVDKGVPGQKPVVVLQNGVPVVHIAPPSADGVSDNRYTQFNVGPGGVVLNNSGGASQTQLAGRISGNPMLGNQRATTILNQVTAPNPSQLLGVLEVAGGRARVIVANPAGITCSGCGFLNSDHATLTTGRPIVGPDGTLRFDVATGYIAVAGNGLLGADLNQVDLIARSLEVNAGIWAQRLNVIAGPSQVDDVTGAVQTRPGEGAAPPFALDTGALGGMYANSIRLIGTEAGVGVNIAGNLIAMTGDLHVNAAGDLTIQPGGTAQAAGNAHLHAGRDLAMHGNATTVNTLKLAAGRDASVYGLASSGAGLDILADGDLSMGAQAGVMSQAAVQLIAGRNLTARNRLVLSDGDVTASSGGSLRFETVSETESQTPPAAEQQGACSAADDASPSAIKLATAGVISSTGPILLKAGDDAVLPGQVTTAGNLQVNAARAMSADHGAILHAGKEMNLGAGADMRLAGTLQSADITLNTDWDLSVDGSALAENGVLRMTGGKDVALGAASHVQGNDIQMTATRDLKASGALGSVGPVTAQAGRDAWLDGPFGAAGDLSVTAPNSIVVDQRGQLSAGGSLTLAADQDLDVRGAVRGQGVTMLTAGNALNVGGLVSSTLGPLNLEADESLTIAPQSFVVAGGRLNLRSLGELRTAGTVSSTTDLTLHAKKNASLGGHMHADGTFKASADGHLATRPLSRLDSGGTFSLTAKKSMSVAGFARTNGRLTLSADEDLRVNGNALALGGLNMTAGHDLTLGEKGETQGRGVAMRACRDVRAGGRLTSAGGLSVQAGRDVRFEGETSALAGIVLSAGRDIIVSSSEQRKTLGPSTPRATGTDSAVGAPRLLIGDGRAGGWESTELIGYNASQSETASAVQLAPRPLLRGHLYAGDSLLMSAGSTLDVSAAARVQAQGDMTLKAHDIYWAGKGLTHAALEAHGRHDLQLDGEFQGDGLVRLTSANDLSLRRDSQIQGPKIVARAGRDARIDGVIASHGDATITAKRDATVGGRVRTDGAFDLGAHRSVRFDESGDVVAKKRANLETGGDIDVAGTLRGDRGVLMDAGASMSVDGVANAAYGALDLLANEDLAIGQHGDVSAFESILIDTKGSLDVAGSVTSRSNLTMRARQDATVLGQLDADGTSTMTAQDGVDLLSGSRWTSKGALRIDSAGPIVTAGTLRGTSDVTVASGKQLRVAGNATSVEGLLRLDAETDVTLGKASHTYGRRVAAVATRDLRAEGEINVSGPASFSAGGATSLTGKIAAEGPINVKAGGAFDAMGSISSQSNLTIHVIQDAEINGRLHADAYLLFTALGDVRSDVASRWTSGALMWFDAGGPLTLAGIARSQSGLRLDAGDTLRLKGRAIARGGALYLETATDMRFGGASKTYGRRIVAHAARDLHARGKMDSPGRVDLAAGRDATIANELDTQGALDLSAARDMRLAAPARVNATGRVTADAGEDMWLEGTLHGERAVRLDALGAMTLSGSTTAKEELDLTASADLTIAEQGYAWAAGPVSVYTGRDLLISGELQSRAGLTAQAARAATVDGHVHTAGALDVSSGAQLATRQTAYLDADGPMTLTVQDMHLDGEVSSGSVMSIDARGRVHVAGNVLAESVLAISGLNEINMTAGSSTQGRGMTIASGAGLLLDGTLVSLEDMMWAVSRIAHASGNATSAGRFRVATGDLLVDASGAFKAEDMLMASVRGNTTMRGRMQASNAVMLSTGDTLSSPGHLLAPQGRLHLSATRGSVVLPARSVQQAGSLIRVDAGQNIEAAGTTTAGHDVTLNAARRAALSGLVLAQAGDLTATAAADMTLEKQSHVESGASLSLEAKNLTNAGTAYGKASVRLFADEVLRNTGLARSEGNLTVHAGRKLYQSGKFAAAAEVDSAVGMQAALAVTSPAIYHSGLSQSGHDLTFTGDSLDLENGTVSSAARLALRGTASINTRGATLSGGSVDIAGGDLSNQNSRLSSSDDASINLSGPLDNTASVISVNHSATVAASRILNPRGTFAARHLIVQTPNDVVNQRGLMQGWDVLDLRALFVDNRDTADQIPSQYGLLGRALNITTDSIDNRHGAMLAVDTLTVTTAKDIDNTHGVMSSQHAAVVHASSLHNSDGQMFADEQLRLTLDRLLGLGAIQSVADLFVTINGDLTLSHPLTANRDLGLTVSRRFENHAKVSAGRDITMRADRLLNGPSGKVIAQRHNTIVVNQDLINDGLIDGVVTKLHAQEISQRGRIYGDRVSIQTDVLENDGASPVIASRGSLDLGVARLLGNRNHAFIYAADDMRIGRQLDENGHPYGLTDNLINQWSTIEAGGKADIAAAHLQNLNRNFASEVVYRSSTPKIYYRPEHSTDMYDGATTWLCDLVTASCSKDPAWLKDDQERRLLLPSATYPEHRYGPPFDYARGGRGERGVTAPIWPAYSAPRRRCIINDAESECTMTAEKFFYSPDARIWAVFDVVPPSGPRPEKPVEKQPCWSRRSCDDQRARQQAYEAALASYVAPYEELNRRIFAFNANFDGRMVKNFHIYRVDETVSESRMVSSDPALIAIGGDAVLRGNVLNDKSRILAGGALNVLGQLQNIGATGERRVEQQGTVQRTYEKKDKRKYDAAQPYTGQTSVTPIELPVFMAAGYQSVSTREKPGASTPDAAERALEVKRVALDNGAFVLTTPPPALLPDSQLFVVSREPQALHRVKTDPEFIGERPVVSSDYLLRLLADWRGADRVIKPSGIDKEGPLDIWTPPVGLNPHTVSPIDVDLNSDGVRIGVSVPAADSAVLLHGAAAGGWGALAPAGARFLTPAGQPKRLGDGFYEQKLVRDQIYAATGQRYLDNYLNATQQFLDLMAAGAEFAAEHDLKLGASLSAEQMRHLTTDLIWLVEQPITLRDGTIDHVLVPQVYLIVRDGDLKTDGTLMAGDTVNLFAEGEITNTGSIGARRATVIAADTIVNRSGGSIHGGSIDLTARDSIANIAALIKGGNVTLTADRDIALTSTTSDYHHGQTAGRDLAGVSQVQAETLQINAGQDIRLTAASVNAKGSAGLQAGRDIELGTVTQAHRESYAFGRRNSAEFRIGSEIGSGLAVGEDLSLLAGRDVNVRASEVAAGATLSVGAGRDIRLTAGEATGAARDERYSKTRKFLSRKTEHSILSVEWSRAQATTFTADAAILVAGRDLDVAGSTLGTQGDLILSAERNVNLIPGRNTADSSHYERVRKTGFGAMGGLSYGSRKQTDSVDSQEVYHTAGTLGSVEGDVHIHAGRDVNVTAGRIIAPRGDINLNAQHIHIGAAQESALDRERHELRQSGLTLTASNPVVSAMQTGARMADAASRTENPVMQGLAAGTTALAAANAYDAVKEAASAENASDIAKVGGVSVKLSLGSNKSSSRYDSAATSAVGSAMAAGRDVNLMAEGAGPRSDISIIGSTLLAGRNVSLMAEGDLLLQAARNAAEFQSSSKDSGGSIGIGYSTGQTTGLTLELGASIARGTEHGKEETWTHSHVTAGETLRLQSGGDTALRGATGHAEQIVANIGGDLRIESLQDKSRYASKTRNGDIEISLCLPPSCVGNSIAGGFGVGRMKSDFESVTEQSGLWAGDGGFQIDVKNNTRLIGGVIASSDAAIADKLNKLGTGTLVTEDIKNTARYSAHQVSVSGGVGFGGGKSKDSGLGTTKDGQVAGGTTKESSTSASTGAGGLGMGMPMVAAASGSSSSITYSAISAGDIFIRNEAAQQDLTGMTATETIASLNRDTSDTLNTLRPIFDKEKIEAGFEIAQEASRQVGQFLENRAKEIENAKSRSDDPSLSYAERAQAAQQYADLETKWGAQGTHSRWAPIILGAASGNVMGGTGQFVQAAAVNYLQALGAAEIKELSHHLGGEGSVGHAALHAVLGCAGAAAQGASCGAGGAGAFAGVVLNSLVARLEQDKTQPRSPEEAQARANLVSSVVAGVAAAIDPAAAVPAELAARIEVENNSLYRHRDKVARLKAEVTRIALESCASDNACLQAEFARADRAAAAYETVLMLRHYPAMSKEKADMLAQAVLDIAPVVSSASAMYELVTGLTATGDEANRFLASIGVVPVVGGIMKKGTQAIQQYAKADKVLDVSKVGSPKGIAKHARINASELKLTRTVENHLNDLNKAGDRARPYGDSRALMQEIIDAKPPSTDPRGVPGALRWDVEGTMNGSKGTYELVVDTNTNTVLHFLFKSGQ